MLQNHIKALPFCVGPECRSAWPSGRRRQWRCVGRGVGGVAGGVAASYGMAPVASTCLRPLREVTIYKRVHIPMPQLVWFVPGRPLFGGEEAGSACTWCGEAACSPYTCKYRMPMGTSWTYLSGPLFYSEAPQAPANTRFPSGCLAPPPAPACLSGRHSRVAGLDALGI